jgi:hypothetical protein
MTLKQILLILKVWDTFFFTIIDMYFKGRSKSGVQRMLEDLNKRSKKFNEKMEKQRFEELTFELATLSSYETGAISKQQALSYVPDFAFQEIIHNTPKPNTLPDLISQKTWNDMYKRYKEDKVKWTLKKLSIAYGIEIEKVAQILLLKHNDELHPENHIKLSVTETMLKLNAEKKTAKNDEDEREYVEEVLPSIPGTDIVDCGAVHDDLLAAKDYKINENAEEEKYKGRIFGATWRYETNEFDEEKYAKQVYEKYCKANIKTVVPNHPPEELAYLATSRLIAKGKYKKNNI